MGSSSDEYEYKASSMLIDADNDDRLGFVRKVYGILAA